ncbi:MAG: phosphate ABC transporter permease PstA [Thermoguttaceae bacterium]|nr:phosphate ABC transporter permease PstA [Thermoguttaceae bacterium]MDW8078357.1 phosphate ABC transporter permease PstA [Thermoguttaceae bacterium]
MDPGNPVDSQAVAHRLASVYDQPEHPASARVVRGAAWIAAAYNEPGLWLMGGALLIALGMVTVLLGYIAIEGLLAFWPREVVSLQLETGEVVCGEIVRSERYVPEKQALNELPEVLKERAFQAIRQQGAVRRYLVRIGNYELTGEHFRWVSEFEIAGASRNLPSDIAVFERRAWGRFYGFPAAFVVDGKIVAEGVAQVWQEFERAHPQVLSLWGELRRLERVDLGRINRRMEEARLSCREVELRYGEDSAEADEARRRWQAEQAALEAQAATVEAKITKLREEIGRWAIQVKTADGKEASLPVGEIVRAYLPNRLNWWGKFRVYLARLWEFVSDEPREANSEGGVFPAIFGTVLMTLLMALGVAPFGVVAAIYLREYAKAGLVVSAVRIAVNNLAGVPSIVFGVFGLGFFCYTVGASIDQLFYAARLPSPTFGSGGILWASLTLALLTLPVVIVATEEALAAVPNSVREGSLACGATKWQTIRRVVLPQAMPGVLTGMILAMARGAGEVAPLMLVGVVKLAPELPVDGEFPFFHPERSFMHLGFHIYDLGFQSQNAEAARPMVFATALLLVLIIFTLNLAAIYLRARLRRRFLGARF